MDSSGNDPLGDARRDLYTVTEISEAVRQHLESEFPRLNVIGEIANFKLHTSGHAYFTLRDSANMIHVVLFRRYAERVACSPANGMLVIAPGRVSHFGGSGQTQLIATDLIPAGRGDVELEFRRLLKKLMDEGLTAAGRKRSIPRYPVKIAVITSPTGAVIRDVVDTIRRRWPVAEIVHVRADVQGPGSAQSIACAFEVTNGIGDIDTIILARGGGSVEDLWSFNSEQVARAVAGSAHPVITGIGHEIDTTVADHVADVRAATPTAAAELATPLIDAVRRELGDTLRRMSSVETAVLVNRRHLVEYLIRSSAFPAIEHRMERAELEIDGLLDRMSDTGRLHVLLESTLDRLRRRNPSARMALAAGSIVHALRVMMMRLDGELSLKKNEVAGKLGALAGLDPRGVLKRGYSFCTEGDGVRVIPRAEKISRGDELTVHFYDGGVLCSVREKKKGRPWRKK